MKLIYVKLVYLQTLVEDDGLETYFVYFTSEM